MKITRFISGAIAADGGTVACTVILDDGSELDLGVDGRIPKTKKGRVVFVGAGYPTLPGAQLFARGSKEEKEVVEAVGLSPKQIRTQKTQPCSCAISDQ